MTPSIKPRKILVYDRYKAGEGTHYYDVKYQGEWEDKALINALDLGETEPDEERYKELCTKQYNFGGFVEVIYKYEDDKKRARVGVYYD